MLSHAGTQLGAKALLTVVDSVNRPCDGKYSYVRGQVEILMIKLVLCR